MPQNETTAPHENPHGALAYGVNLIEKYKIGKFVIADGEGLFYRAVDIKTTQKVFIKEYLPVTLTAERNELGEVTAKDGCEVMFKTTRMDFAELYNTLQRLTPCVGLMDVIETFDANETTYAVMECVEGLSLTRYLRENKGKISQERAKTLLKPIFEGVETMHGVGLIHRGICADNIIIPPNGPAKLIGYATIGLRTVGDDLHAQLYEGYCAPEQYSTSEFEGIYTDTYALSALYYTVLTGKNPYSAAQRLVQDANPSAKSLEPSIPQYVSHMLTIGLSLKPAERVQKASELFECLNSQKQYEDLAHKYKKRTNKNKQKNSASFSMTNIIAFISIMSLVLACLAVWLFLGGQGKGKEDIQRPTPSPTQTPVQQAFVDDFVGFTFEQLQSNTAYSEKYLFRVVEEEFSDMPVGIVLSQNPQQGEELTAENQIIELVVSKGLEMVEIPNTTGFTQATAEEEFIKAGLTASFVMRENDGSYASGCVIKTDPAFGTSVETGSVITVYIAADRDVEIVPTPTPTVAPSPTPSPSIAPSPTPKPTASIEPSPTLGPVQTQTVDE